MYVFLSVFTLQVGTCSLAWRQLRPDDQDYATSHYHGQKLQRQEGYDQEEVQEGHVFYNEITCLLASSNLHFLQPGRWIVQVILRVLCVLFTFHSGCFGELYNMDCSLAADVLGKHADGFRITGQFSHLSLISVIAIEVDMPWKSISEPTWSPGMTRASKLP